MYYIMGFLVLLVSGALLMLRGRSVLASPYVLTVSSLIPLGISMGIAEQYFPSWKRAYKWFALIGFLAIAITSIGQMGALKKIAVPLFHGGAGLVIIFGPFLARKAPVGFRWVGALEACSSAWPACLWRSYQPVHNCCSLRPSS